MNKILVVGTGGTIACAYQDRIRLKDPFRILELVSRDDVEFDCVSPFSVLSENMSVERWQQLIDCLESSNLDRYAGAVILHGSDTLAYTGAVLGNIFYDKRIVLVAANRPIDDEASNAAANFNRAVDFIIDGADGVYISYDRLYRAVRTVSAAETDEFFTAGKAGRHIAKPRLKNRNILVIRPYPGIDYGNYDLSKVDIVLHGMYHSATVPQSAVKFSKECGGRNIPFYFVTVKSKAEYESMSGVDNIIFNTTLENAYARALLF